MGDLVEVAAAVETAYTRRRQVFHPSWRGTERWRPFWLKAADTLRRAGVEDVPGYVEAQFEMLKPFPQPNMLHSPAALTRYRDWETQRRRAGRETEWELQVRCELDHILSRRNLHGADDARTLFNPAAPLSPLCRVACLLRLGRPPGEIPRGWREAAVRLARVPAAANAYRSWKILDDQLLERVLDAPGS